MKKYFIIAALLSFFCLNAFCQYGNAHIIDSIRLDSLKRILPLAKEKVRVDLLNSICTRTAYFERLPERTDSMHYYASKALDEANKMGYKKGIAIALINLSGLEAVGNMPVIDKDTLEKNIKKVIQLGEEINDNDVLGWGYYCLSGAASVKNDFEKHVDCYKKSISYFQKSGNVLLEAEVTNWLCGDYLSTGEYEKAFDYGKKSVAVSKKSGTDISNEWHEFLVQFSLDEMSELYIAAGDYESAMNCLREMEDYGKDHEGAAWDMPALIANLFCQMGKYDSATVYMNRWIKEGPGASTGKGHQAWGWSLLGQIYLNNTKEYDKAIEIFRNWTDTLKKYHSAGIYAATRLIISTGQAYDGKKNYNTALKYAKQGFSLAQEKNNRPEMMRAYQVLSTVYHHLGNNDSAYKYLLKYNAIKDSIENKQFLLRIYNSKKDAEDAKKESRIGLLNRDNQIKQQKLKQEATFRNFLISFFIAIIFAGLYVFRNLNLKEKNERLQQEQKEQEWKLKQLESKNKQVKLQRQAAELEMQALRAQMNPHFIFNCLSSINRFILKNESKTASNYLTRFSRLIRMVLINSQKQVIALEEELQMLRLYLDMERLRFKDNFDYVINFTNAIDVGAVLIPPLILQPFCENALWHGLMHKEGQGHLTIDLRMENNILLCMISDDGVGREKAAEIKSKSVEVEKSMGLQITAQRLALINQNNNVQSFYTIEDIAGENKNIAGTRVTLKIRYKELTEEFA